MKTEDKRKQKQQVGSQQALGQGYPPPILKSGLLSTQLSGVPSPSMPPAPGFFSMNAKSMSSGAFGASNTASLQDFEHTQQVSKVQQNKVFNYEVSSDKQPGSSNPAFDLQPQYSIHSPFRSNEGRRAPELNSQPVLASQQSHPDSAVRGVKVTLSGDYNEQLRSYSPSKDNLGSNLVNLHLNTYQSLPNGIGLAQHLKGPHPREKSEGRKDSNHSSTGQGNFKNRKSSTDSNLRSGRATSNGRSDKKRGKSTSNSQSRSKQSQERMAAVTGAHSQNQSKHLSALKRPNSAKNLKQTPSMASMQLNQRAMVTSPTLTVLQREPSQGNFLPPKPKQPIRNQTQAKLPLFLYQSVGVHPASASQSQQHSQSNSKRAPSSSTERKTSSNPTSKASTSKQNQLNNPQILVEQDNVSAFSPIRKNMHHLTQPTSNTKNSHSGHKKRQKSQSKKKLLSSNKKGQNRGNNLYVQEQQQLQQLSPNLGRVRVQDQNEEQKEDSWKQNQPLMHSFDQSEIKPINHHHEIGSIQLGATSGELDSSLSFRLAQQKIKLRQLNENTLPADLLKQMKQQIQSVTAQQTEEDKKKKKLLIEKREKIKQVTERVQTVNVQQPVVQPKKFNLDQMKDQLSKKLQETKVLASKQKKQATGQQEQQQKEIELIKKKKQEQREQWQKEREERHECLEIVKDAIKQNVNSTSITRKREQSKGPQQQDKQTLNVGLLQRPFSAKTTQGDHQQQLLIKVPPVHEENTNYEPVYSQMTSGIAPALTETSPLKDHKYEHARVIGSSMSEVNLGQQKPGMTEFIKKQKRERSKRKKLEMQNEVQAVNKKNEAYKNLKEQYKKNFEVFKQGFVPPLINKGKKKNKHLKSAKVIGAGSEGQTVVSQHTETTKRTTQRSKSKRRLDEEKENRRLSLSPGSGAAREGRSGTRSRSDKKRKQISKALLLQQEQLQLKHMQQNVLELLQQQDKNLKNLTQNMKLQKNYQKSQTVADLHQNIDQIALVSQPSQPNFKNQIILSKQQLKQIIEKQKQDSKPQSSYDNDSFTRQDQSFTNPQQLSTIQGENQSKNILMISHPQSLKQLMSMDAQQTLLLQSEQSKQEMTPIILQKKNIKTGQAPYIPDKMSQENKQSLVFNRPGGDSLQSFQFGLLPNSMSQSREGDLSIFKTQDRQNVEQQQQIMPEDYRSVTSLQQKEGYMRSRSGSVEGGEHVHSNSRQRSAKKKKAAKAQAQVLSPTKVGDQKLNKEGSGQKSKKKLTRKGSAGQKKPLLPQQPVGDMNILRQVQSQVNKQLPQRPKSANVQLNIIDFVQQQQRNLQLQEQLEKKLLIENKKKASIKIQKYLRGYLARQTIHQLKQEREHVDREFKLVQQQYWNKDPVRSSLDKQTDPARRSTQEPKLAQLQPNLNLLEESKDKSVNSQNTSQQESLSKLSKSEANLKNIIAMEQEKLRKQQRPTSSRPGSSEAKGPTPPSGLVEEQKVQIPKRVLDRLPNLRDSEERKSRDNQPLFSQPSNQQSKQDFELPRRSTDSDVVRQTPTQELKRVGSGRADPIMRRAQTEVVESTPVKTEESKRESFLEALENETAQKMQQQSISQLHKAMTAKIKPRGQSEDAAYNNSQNYQAHSNSQIFGSDDRDISWQFDRRSFQDFFEHNSQILQEESKRRSLGPHGFPGDPVSKQNLQTKMSQYDNYVLDMEKRTEKGREELKKLNDRKHLSPSSMKKKSMLEKWVNKQEEKLNILNQRKKWISENVNDMIAKMDHDLQNTKKKIGSGRKGSLKFGDSHEWSQVDMSIGHITSSSVQSTPRIYSLGIGGQQQSQPNQALTNNNKSEREKPRKLFDYKIPTKERAVSSTESKDGDAKTPLILDEESKEPMTNKGRSSINSMSSKMSEVNREEIDKLSDNFDQRQDFPSHHENNLNIFKNNLEESGRPSSRNNADTHVQSLVEEHGTNDDDDENESLSKMEPPQFQSPTISTISPNQQMKEYFSDEDDRPQNHPFMLVDAPSDRTQGHEEKSEEAFLALKEPEQPLTYKSMKEQREMNEMLVDNVTDLVMKELLDSLKNNLFPKRVIIPYKSPSKEDDDQADSQQQEQIKASQDFEIEANDPDVVEEIIDTKEESRKKAEEELKMIEEQIKQQMALKHKQRLRGIKTNMRIVDTYVAQVFKKVKDQEDEFIENLSTPLNKDPLEILLHLQNVFIDNELENAISFQQSVLPVDLYLDIERNKADVQQVDGSDNEEQPTNKSMLGEWENIHNKVIFDAINEALDNFRPYGLRGPPMPWSQQTRTLTYKNGQQVDQVLRSVRLKVMEWARTFAGALSYSELLLEYGIKGPLDEDKLNLLREERLALVLAAEIEENEMLWTDYEYEETQTKLDVADMILEFLAEEAAKEFNKIKESRQEEKEMSSLDQRQESTQSNLNV